MKKTIAFVMALAMMSTMFTACGGKTETDDTSSQAGISVEEGTKASEETDAETETESETETEAETEALTVAGAGLMEGIILADTPSFVVTDHDVEIGDWEGYVEKFEMPENIVMSVAVSEKENTGMVFGLANGTTMLRMNFEAPDSFGKDDDAKEADEGTKDKPSDEADVETDEVAETEVKTETEAETEVEDTEPVPISYTLYATEEAVYTYMVVNGVTDAKKGNVSSDENAESSVEDTLSGYDASEDKFTFKKYGDKETIDGKDYDVIICSMTKKDNDDDIEAKLYFDENGGFYKLSYEEESGKAEIYEAKSIDIPDVNFEEADATELSMSLLGIISTFAFSSMADAMEEETSETVTEAEPAETEETAISEEATASEE